MRLLAHRLRPNPEDAGGLFHRRISKIVLPSHLTISLRTCRLCEPRCIITLNSPSPSAIWEGCMSSGPQVSPTIAYGVGVFENNSSHSWRSRCASAVASPSVLLVGRTGSWGRSVLKSLEKFGTELIFIEPQAVTPERIRETAYNVVLLDSTVSPEQRRRLAAALIGSNVSIFYTFPVENGCWWLPTLRDGQDCHGTPAFRRNEFRDELERILRYPTAD